MARPLVKTHIRGFDEDVLRGGIPQGHVVLVRGASGTMKSSLAYYVLYHNALAAWDALELVLEFDDRRAETFGFFEWLRDLGVTSLLISEEPSLEAPPTALEEEFLADGIIHLRLEPVTETAFQRRVQCVKMRSVNQDSDDHTLLFENGRFEVARAIG